MKKYLVLMVAALVLSACGGSSDNAAPDQPAPSTDAPATSNLTGPSDPAEMTIEAAAEQYLEMVAPSRCGAQKFREANDTLDDDSSFEYWSRDVRPAAAELSSAYATSLEDLSTADWPSEVQPMVDDLVTELAKMVSFYQDLADVGDEDSLVALLEEAPQQGPAAAELRAKLELPPTSDDQSDPCA